MGVPDFDAHASLLSVPFLLGHRSEDDIPNEPYIFADPVKIAHWRDRLDGKRSIGICWAGGKREGYEVWLGTCDAHRSIDGLRLSDAVAYSGFQVVSLQVERAQDLPGIINWSSDLTSFDETAALIANLDLVISVDTAVAHLAGAMGKPVWLLNRFDHCWRWLIGREGTPWYSTMRIYTQKHPGAWEEVLTRVSADLEAFRAQS